MLPFTTQIIEVVAAHYPSNLPSPGDVAAAVVEEANSPRSTAAVADPETGQAQTDGNTNAQLAQQTAFPGLQVAPLISHLVNILCTVHRLLLGMNSASDAPVSDLHAAGPCLFTFAES